jgi:hypothetical protein
MFKNTIPAIALRLALSFGLVFLCTRFSFHFLVSAHSEYAANHTYFLQAMFGLISLSGLLISVNLMKKECSALIILAVDSFQKNKNKSTT